MLYIEFDSEI